MAADDRDDDDSEQPEADAAAPVEAAKPPKPITLSEMALVVVEEAIRRSSAHRAIVKAYGPEHSPSDKALREVEVLHATARFLDTLVPILPDLREIMKDRAKQTKDKAKKR